MLIQSARTCHYDDGSRVMEDVQGICGQTLDPEAHESRCLLLVMLTAELPALSVDGFGKLRNLHSVRRSRENVIFSLQLALSAVRHTKYHVCKYGIMCAVMASVVAAV